MENFINIIENKIINLQKEIFDMKEKMEDNKENDYDENGKELNYLEKLKRELKFKNQKESEIQIKERMIESLIKSLENAHLIAIKELETKLLIEQNK